MARKVLVIDDSPTIHKVVDSTLKKLQLEVAHAKDGEAGMARAREERPDLILVDFMMPGLNGYQVCKALFEDEALARVPVVLMSAKGELIGERLVKTLGIVDFITKPFSPEALATVVMHALDAKRDEAAAPAALMNVGERLPDAPATSEDLSDPRGIPALRGDLAMVSPGELLQLLKFQSHTGILHMARGEAHLEVFLQDGGVAFARAQRVDEEFLLGRFLVEIGAITARDLEVFLQNRQGTRKLLGEQLLRLGQVTGDKLKEALARQTEALLYEAIRWGEGEFAFFATDNLPAEALESGLHLSIDQILMEGFRRIDEWGLIEKEIRDFDLVLAPCQDSTGIIRRVKLEPDEERILALVDGQRTIREIIRQSRRSSFDVCKILFRLLQSRIVRKRSRAEPAEGERA